MDAISNFINTLKTASRGKKPSFEFPASRLITSIATALLAKGYLGGFGKKDKQGRRLECRLVYTAGVPKVQNARRISRPSKRVYREARELHSVRNGFGMAVLSTPKGILCDTDARKQNVGGEVLFEVW